MVAEHRYRNKTERDADAWAIDTMRTLAMDAVEAAKSGHPGTPMALAPLAWAIFSKLRKHDPRDPNWIDRDRFVLSCGHASMLQYGALFCSGYDITLDDIKNFRQWQSKTPGHPEAFHTPGVEITTGPLGQGIASAVGMAMAERHLASRFNTDEHAIFDHRVWVIASDGDLMEGVSAEAASLAGHLKLNKICAFWDDNSITIDGRTDLSFSEDVLKRYQAYGWHTLTVENGEDLQAIVAAGKEAIASDKPTMVRIKTVIGFPAPTLSDSPKSHGAPLGEDEIKKTKEIMGWPQENFFVPRELSAATEEVRIAGGKARAAWQTKFEDWRAQAGEQAAALDAALAQTIPELDNLTTFSADKKGMATRAAGGKLIAEIAAQIPSLVGGSADLAGSNKTALGEVEAFSAEQKGIPRTVYWGVREHAMAAAVNGMALHGGVMPFCATFLVFSDYMKPALRLAALNKLKTRYVFSHDSIGVGEDGPTHQPIEHLAMLRSLPNFAVFRPGDANETSACWQAMLNWDGPAAMVLTRQNVPTLERGQSASAALSARGAYTLYDGGTSDTGDVPEVILLATGSELHLAYEAAQRIAKNKRVRVVSMPCWALFDAQDKAYRESILPLACQKRVVIEAATSFGWHRYAGSEGAFITLDHFGASAPAEKLFTAFGFSVDAICASVDSLF